jgi:hypothetical protein
VAALAGGSTVEAAAQLCDVSESTIYRRLRDSAFRRRVSQARQAMLERAIGHLAEGSVEASIGLRNLAVRSKDERVQLGAARAILALGVRVRENAELVEELAELRRLVEELQSGDSNYPNSTQGAKANRG